MFDTLVLSSELPLYLKFRRGGGGTVMDLSQSSRSDVSYSSFATDVVEIKKCKSSPSMPKSFSQPPVPRWNISSTHFEGEVDLTVSDEDEAGASLQKSQPIVDSFWRKGQIVKTEFGVGSVYKEAKRSDAPV